MPVTPQESETYRLFVVAKAQELGCFNFKPDDVVWHYTNGDGEGFLGILQTSSIYATQVSSLNDRNETKYATDLYKKSIENLIEEKKADPTARDFLLKVLEFVKEDPSSPAHGTSKFFVTCFSGEEDELTQWDRYGKPNAYAIGFYARGFFREPSSTLYKVAYDRGVQKTLSKDIAEATLKFYLDGLSGERLQAPEKWAEEFFAAWDEWIYRLAPIAKDPNWRSEREFRIIHELKIADFPDVRFRQRGAMLSRYLPLSTPGWVKRRSPLLPIAKITIGPGNHPAFSRISVMLPLEQMGYPNIPVELTKVSLQWP
jgi:hypothetical protein